MERSEVLLTIATFVFGFVVGVYTYFMIYEPAFRLPSSATSEADATFTVTAEAYGECETSDSGCGSFRLLSNREYRVVFTDSAGVVQRSREGLLSRTLRDDLQDEIRRAEYRDDLNQYPSNRPLCSAGDTDGVLYTLSLAVGDQYYLDACSGAVEPTDDLYLALERVSASLQIRGR